MGCRATFNFSAAPAEGDTPLDDAVYYPAIGKIIGTCENYVLTFNATTGAYESSVKAISPMYGPMRICLVNGEPWISCLENRSEAGATAAEHILKDLFKLNAVTLEADTGGIGLPTKNIGGTDQYQEGPTQIVSAGDRIYFGYIADNASKIGYIDTTNIATFATVNAQGIDGYCEQFGTDGTYFYGAGIDQPGFQRHDAAAFATTEDCPTDGYWAIAAEWVSGTVNKCFGVCGDKWLLRVDAWDPGSSFTTYDLETLIVASGITGIKPIRLRYWSVTDKVYIPVANKDIVIIFDPVLETATWIAGFDSPIDLVFTDAKVFAVQSGLVGLREVV